MSTLSTVHAVLPSEAIVERIANREGVDPLELPPLYDAIDPDALDALVESAGEGGCELRLEFTYHGYQLAITGDGVIHIDEDTVPIPTVA